jgi:MoxR-like ATPase
MPDWLIYSGSGQPHGRIDTLPPPPPWRVFDGGPSLPIPTVALDPVDLNRAVTYRPDPATIELVNAALYLRRPLLVTGRPGTGKSTLAHAVAYELGLGPVLKWPITSKTILRDGLYTYDPLSRLHAASRGQDNAEEDIGRYLRLGPLGTALLPYARPRVLLIDEIDKSDLDLPNDLLTIFEEGWYDIPELVRIAEQYPRQAIMVADNTECVPVVGGRVHCHSFPLVVMTSNGEREFPPAFLRRCILLELPQPDRNKLTEIVRAHMPDYAEHSEDLITRFLNRATEGELATDQLLNSIYLTNLIDGQDRAELAERLMPYLSPNLVDPDDA